MSDILVVVCGGGARSLLSNADDVLDVPIEYVSKEHPLEGESSNELIDKMKDYRIVIPFAVLGGEKGTEATVSAISCARCAGCKVMSVVGIPFDMEPDRRALALEMKKDIVKISDCVMFFDMEASLRIYNNRKVGYFIKMVDRSTVFAMNSMIEAMEGPFFTLFPDREYTFVGDTAVLAIDAVKESVKVLYEVMDDPLGEMTIMVGSRVTSVEMNQISDYIVKNHGTMPRMVRRNDEQDTKVIVFMAGRSL